MVESQAPEGQQEPIAVQEEQLDDYPAFLRIFMVFTLIDLLAPLFVRLSPLTALGLCGAVAGQVAVVGFWSAFAPISLMKRIALPLVCLSSLTGCLVAASAIGGAIAHCGVGSLDDSHRVSLHLDGAEGT